MSVKILCYSGGKDSTAMLIHLLESNQQIDEILYVDVGDWMWNVAKSHIKQVEDTFGVEITQLNVSDDIDKGFQRWGFPSFFNRWCTGIKRDTMRDYLREKYEDDTIIQYVGYCADEEKRTNKKLYSSFEVEYPLVDAGISTSDALQLCKEHGFDFGGVYEHHSHFNCWMCPLQKVNELKWVFDNEPEYWNILREMQHSCDGYYQNGKTIFDYEKQFWEKNCDDLKQKRMDARRKYNRG